MGGKRRAASVLLALLVTGLGHSAAATARPTVSPTVSSPVPTVRPTRTPTPRPRTPTPQPPTPTPTPVPTIIPTVPPPPPAPCDTRVPQATGAGGFLQVAGVAGYASEPSHTGAIVLTGVSPSSMLPPAVGTVPLTEVTLVKATDRSSQALVQAVASGTHFDCVQVEMGPSREFIYATYAFHDAQFATYAPSGGPQSVEMLTLTYVTVDWEYQLRDGTPVATGTGTLGSTPNPRALQAAGMALGPPLLVAVLLLAGLLAGVVLWLRRRGRRVRGTAA